MSNDLKPIQITVSPDGFMNMLHSQNGGAFVGELNEKLAEGVQAVLDNGGKAEMNVIFKFSKSVGVESGITIEHDLKTKFPQETRQQKVMFANSHKGLLNAPEKQGELGLGDEIEPVRTGLEEAGKNISSINR